VQLSVGFLEEGNPKLISIRTVTIEGSFCLGVEGNSSVDNYIPPFAILKELEHGESMLNSIMNNEVAQQLRVSALDQERTKEPAVSEDTLLYVTWAH